MKNIVIIGMPGSGKTTFGSALAERLGRQFIDADVYIEAREQKKIPELFAISENCFREAETRAMKELAKQDGIVIATGGGVIKRPVNIEVLKKTGIVIFIDREPDDIIGDVIISTRPLLADGKQKIYDLYNERIGVYRLSADLQLANKGVITEVLEQLVMMVGEALKN
ncbi:shikimate kinase [Megasphaera paucivorans]|uniref:Shikimate kinase n=1 Tax=Megasphaera paucivorans TaxID=349095 RepID=A0A1G9Z336_9FIRM|nr:shikimate kinase [Megasphaera paucivorans]SDN15858.1 shikimate kinase [Megasphaera paucivorans]